MDVFEMTLQAGPRILLDLAFGLIEDLGHFGQMLLGYNLRDPIGILERFLFMAKQTELTVSILEDPSCGLILDMEEMARSAGHERVLMLVEILHNSLMTITAGENDRVPLDFFIVFSRLGLMAVITLVNNGVDPRFFNLGQEVNRLVRTMAFDASRLLVGHMKEGIMFNRIDLRETVRARI